eukprot:TRINITY_DN113021_c0_g1_i1.p1 TRINITY_DN113021_c0_g1~~TRINITY_DN113021_c0_g1_i1.p1  ORF type:complete len:578 (-),score=136.47 TRINITY_DN113021_c0_g1_i1:188-1921(-)
MGLISKLSFWKRSKASAVEPFQAPEDEIHHTIQVTKGSPVGNIKIGLTASSSPSPKATVAANEVVASNDEVRISPATSPKLSLSSPTRSSPKAVAAFAPIGESDLRSACAADTAPDPELIEVLKGNVAAKPLKPLNFADRGLREAATRTPSPECPNIEEDCLNFDAPLDKTIEGVSEAFGKMIASSLQASKWDKRSQALKSITTVLRGLDLRGMAPPGSTGVLGKGLKLRDRTRCWRLSCQLLNHLIRDKVMPVRLAALDLFIDTFTNAEDVVEPAEVRYAAGVLVEHIIATLGDSNLRLHEGARKCVFFAADKPGMLGLGIVLNKLRSRLDKAPKGAERTKAHFGVLDTVSVLLENFPARRVDKNAENDLDNELEDVEKHCTSTDSWVADDVAPFIVLGMDDSAGTRVRNAAVALAVTTFQNSGMEAMEPMLKTLRPAKQTLLKQKFAEVEQEVHPMDMEDDDGDEGEARPDLDGFLVCGAAIRTPIASSGHVGFSLPGMPGADDEDTFMDGILEEAGMVFSSAAEGQMQSPRFGSGDDEDMADDDFLLEQELAKLGLDDIEELDEQQALMMSLCK